MNEEAATQVSGKIHAEEKRKAQRRSSGLQRSSTLGEGHNRKEGELRDKIKSDLEKKIKAIREGHFTGGYCDTEALIAEEKKLYAIVATELESAKRKHGYSPDPKFKHPEIRALEVKLNGLAYKPTLVVKED